MVYPFSPQILICAKHYAWPSGKTAGCKHSSCPQGVHSQVRGTVLIITLAWEHDLAAMESSKGLQNSDTLFCIIPSYQKHFISLRLFISIMTYPTPLCIFNCVDVHLLWSYEFIKGKDQIVFIYPSPWGLSLYLRVKKKPSVDVY